MNDTSQSFSVDFGLGTETATGFTYASEQENAFDVVETRGSERPDINCPSGQWKINKDSRLDLLQSLTRWNLLASNKGLTEFSVERYKFYHCVRANGHGQSSAIWPLSELWTLDPISVLNSETRRIIHIPGLRGDQLRKWLLTDVPSTNIYEGPFESYVPSIIEHWQQTNPSIRPSISELNAALKLLGLASSVRTLRLNESQIEMRVPRTFNSDESDFVNVADVGLAVSTVLPVLVALIQAEQGQLVYIEQPELHLHPGAQWKLAELLAKASERGVHVVIETHSSLLLQGILTCVAKGKITPDKVALHWFTRNDEGVTKVTTADLDAQGRVGDWPEDFSDVEMGSSNDYLDAVESKMFEGTK
jgi:hypothetical protein